MSYPLRVDTSNSVSYGVHLAMVRLRYDMMKLTLDKNCLIDLEENRSGVLDIRCLITLHRAQRLSLSIPAIMASEKLQDGTYHKNFSGFESWLSSLDLLGLKLLYPLAYFDVTYFDRCVFGDEGDTLEKRIHSVLFPGMEFKFSDFCTARGLNPNNGLDSKWRNAKCDVLSMWCHIKNDGDVFVTGDSNFHKSSKKPQLIAMGARGILTPSEAARFADRG